LAQWLPASQATVRRDIAWLAATNQLTRSRGGAQKLQPLQGRKSFILSSEAFQHDIHVHAPEKRAIARYASSLCNNGDTLIINGGTTTFGMAEFLVAKQLTILTNSFLMAQRLLLTSDHDIILPGGKVYREQNVILSPFDNDITQHHYAGKMFMGVHGLSMIGLMEVDPLLIQAEKRLISQAEELIVLVDSSKFARRAGLILCQLDRVSCLITDTAVSDSTVQLLEHAGIKVIAVAPEPADPCA